jgi:soluble lytic murein transglycosylase-like protein
MKPNTQKTEKINKNSNFNFLTLNIHSSLIYLKSSLIRLFGLYGTNFEPEGDETMCNDNQTRTYYKMSWIDYICKNDIRSTIRQGFILYLAVAMLTVPSALCNPQQRMAAFKVPVVETMVASSSFGYGLEPSALLDEALKNPEAVATAIRDNASPFEAHILQAAQTHEVDPTLIRAVIFAESSNNPQAVSKRGAQGLMQLMPSTAKALGIEDSFDPAMNIDGGTRYLRYLLDRFDGDVRLALAAYNAGSRYVKKYGGVPPFKATRQYIKKVLKYQEKFQAELETETSNGSDV